MSRKDERLEIRMDPQLHRQARAYARRHGVSLGAIIRAFLRRLVSREDPMPPPDLTMERMQDGRRGRRRREE